MEEIIIFDAFSMDSDVPDFINLNLKKLNKKIGYFLIIIFVFDYFLFPVPVTAREISIIENIVAETNLVSRDLNIGLPQNKDLEVIKEGYYTLTAYNSDPYQCDNSPCITANGFNVCEHGIEDTIAANFLKFGTKVRIPELYGDKVFIVRDRMNSRYTNRIDIWMLEKQDAKNFGVKVAKIEVLESL